MRKLLVIFPVLFLLSCSGPPKRDLSKIFRYNESANITSLDPAFARSQSNIWAVNQVFNGLVQLDNGLKVQPAIAKSWQLDSMGMVYSFHLRDDVLFHDDQAFTNEEQRRVKASDFEYSFKRLTDPRLAAPGAWIFKNVESFAAQDDTTFVIRLKEPFPAFLGLLSMQYASVVPQEAVEYYGNEFGTNPVGTGPFYHKLWVANEKLVLRKNPDYFEVDSAGNSLPYLEAVAISFIPDKQSAFMEFVKGKLDFMSGIDASYKDELLTFGGKLQPKYQDEFEIYRQPYLNTEYLGILVDSSQSVMKKSPLLDRRVRQAINYGFDRQKMMRYLRNNIGTPANEGMIPKGLQAYDPASVEGYEHNPEKAKQLLVRAGYPKGRGLPPIKLQTNASYLDLCEYIQGELSTLGIPLEVEVTPPSTLRQAMSSSKVPFFRGSWIGDYPDAENYLSLFYSGNFAPDGPNYTHFSNPVFDSLYSTAKSTTDEGGRIKLYRQMDSLVMAEAPVVPLYYDMVLRFFPKTVHGMQGNAMNLLDLKAVWKEE